MFKTGIISYSSFAETPYNYGNLYNWFAVETGKLAPTGWHVPTDDEWTTLVAYLGGDTIAGSKLKSTRTRPTLDPKWENPNSDSNNETSFTALPGGSYNHWGMFWEFTMINSLGYMWSSTEYDAAGSWYRVLVYNSGVIQRSNAIKQDGFSVRCLRDDLVGYTADEIITDADGNIYRTIQIGTQVWLTQNLKVTKLNDNTPIPNITDISTWANLVTHAYCTYNNTPLSTYEDPTFYYSRSSNGGFITE